VSDGSLASALGYKSLAAPTSSTQPEQSGSISGTSTVCTYGAMTSAAAVKNDVTVVYEAFTKSVPNTQAVALFKSGLSKEAKPRDQGQLLVRYRRRSGFHNCQGDLQGGHGVDYRRVHGGMARSQGMQRGTGEVVPTNNLQAALKLIINNFGM